MMFICYCCERKDEKQTLELTSRPHCCLSKCVAAPLKTFCLPLATTLPLPSRTTRPPLRLNPVIFVENYTITKFLSLPWDNILVIMAAQEVGQNQETSSAPVHHWSHFDMQIKQMQAFRV